MKSGVKEVRFKKYLFSIISFIFLISMFSFVSATCGVNTIGGQKTYAEINVLDGKGNQVEGCVLSVKCNRNGFVNTPANKMIKEEGKYYFGFLRNNEQSCNKQCNNGDVVTAILTSPEGPITKTGVVSNGWAYIEFVLEEEEEEEETMVVGTIYNSDYSKTIAGANVFAICNDIQKSTTSLSDGTYSLVYTEEECKEGDELIVYAEKDGATGSETGVVEGDIIPNINLAIVNVPLVPEFGVIVGGLTILSAVGVFFIIRKR